MSEIIIFFFFIPYWKMRNAKFEKNAIPVYGHAAMTYQGAKIKILIFFMILAWLCRFKMYA